MIYKKCIYSQFFYSLVETHKKADTQFQDFVAPGSPTKLQPKEWSNIQSLKTEATLMGNEPFLSLGLRTINSYIWPIDKTLLDTTILGLSGSGSDGNEGALRISQSSSIAGVSTSDCLVSYLDTRWRSLTPLQKCSRCILQH